MQIPIDRFSYHVPALRGIIGGQANQEELHQPSPLESWLQKETDRFFDIDMLNCFRLNYLSSGTMNWPNREIHRLKYIYGNGRAVPNPDFRADKRWFCPCLMLDRWKGRRCLTKQYRNQLADLTQSAEWFTDTNVGKPFHVRIHGKIVTEPILRHAYYVRQLTEIFPEIGGESLTVMEVGAGYGSLAGLLKRRNPKLKFILTDLPERLALQAFYLTKSFPDARIHVCAEKDRFHFHDADFELIPTWKLPELPDNSVSIAINTHSMQEMTNAQVRYYLDIIDRVTSSGFYCVNRYEKQIGEEIIRHPAETLKKWNWELFYDAPQPGYTAIRESFLAPKLKPSL